MFHNFRVALEAPGLLFYPAWLIRSYIPINTGGLTSGKQTERDPLVRTFFYCCANDTFKIGMGSIQGMIPGHSMMFSLSTGTPFLVLKLKVSPQISWAHLHWWATLAWASYQKLDEYRIREPERTFDKSKVIARGKLLKSKSLNISVSIFCEEQIDHMKCDTPFLINKSVKIITDGQNQGSYTFFSN